MKINQFKLITLFFLLFSFQKSNAQNIELNNPSFEDFPHPGHAPRGWMDCGQVEFPQETPPDVHPAPQKNLAFGVDLSAQDKSTYLGLIVRESESWESVAQKLKTPLQKGKCYTFSIHLAHSNTYSSAVRGSKEIISFTTPIILRVWGGKGYCDKEELLMQSDDVDNIMWEKFIFYFSPTQDLDYIKLEAFYDTSLPKVPNGNLLLDNASAFQVISCDDEKMKLKKIRENIDMEAFELNKKNALKFEVLDPKDTYKDIFKEAIELSRTRKKITPFARKVKFKKNILTPKGVSNLQKIIYEIEDNPDFKLIIDFNGVRNERATIREESIMEVFNEANFPKEDYEIRNLKEEDGRVIWFIERSGFYLGVMERALDK